MRKSRFSEEQIGYTLRQAEGRGGGEGPSAASLSSSR
jgi:hypothetical protein